MRMGVSAALLALKVFKVDAVALVRAGVEADIEASDRLAEPPTPSACRRRLNILHQWERSPKPFAAEREPYYALLRAVVTDPDLVAQGLPGAKTNKMSVDTFCAHVHDVVKPGGVKAGLMIVPKGSFVPVCRVALQAIKTEFGKSSPANQKNVFIKVFAKALSLSDIHHFPYQFTGIAVGQPSLAPKWDSWCTFGGAEVTADRTIRPSTLLPSEAAGFALRTALQGASQHNILGDWQCAHVGLGDLLDVLKHEKLPQNFVRLGDENYVTRNMDWVIDKFDFGNKLHTLALLYGFIVKHLNPAIYAPKNYSELLHAMQPEKGRKSTLEALRKLPWDLKGGDGKGKGNVQTDAFVVMFTAMVIGIYEDESPLSEYMTAHKYSLGKPWTSKYGESAATLWLELFAESPLLLKAPKAFLLYYWRGWALSGQMARGSRSSTQSGAD